ncbi:hypothetical protein ACIP88_05095 [Streptomyces uncialis]|uniref:hypothetical protein n=1 Tax=Streptomyces uncialis TaxID=1048205 RepID=UPI00381D6CE3
MPDEITGYPGHFIVNGDSSECPCPEHASVPARTDLERLAGFVGSPEYSVWYELLLDRYRDEIAHELAEQIRESSRSQYSRVIGVWGADRARDWFAGRENAADLIDPEGHHAA